jgi:small subunit ribosomal protein S19e
MSSGGVSVRDVDAQKFIKAYAAHLKRAGKLAVPSWVDIVKTGTHKELAPYDPDWFFVRCASVARQLYIRPGAGVGGLASFYGGRKNKGVRPSKHSDASTSVVRKALQALEKLSLLEKDGKGGRRVSPAGQRDLDRVAALCAKTN